MVNVTQRLLHVEMFLSMTMWKGIMHMKLIKNPSMRNNKYKNKPQSGLFDNRTKVVKKFLSQDLVEVFWNKLSHVLFNYTIHFVFGSKNPFWLDNIHAKGRWHKT